jgi:hypothetical protein
MDDPYSQTAKLLDAGPSPAKRTTSPAAPSVGRSPVPDVVVGKRYEDPESRADEEYMAGAQKRIEKRLSEGAERISGEYTKRRFNDRRYGRRSSR